MDQPSSAKVDAEWREMLIEGHKGLAVMRRAFRYLPSAPRCKVCNNPFGGIGGKVVGLAGFKPSRKNPNVCAQCCDKLPPGGALVDIGVLFADVRSSTQLGSRLDPVSFAQVMNRFYRMANGALLAHDAIIDKLIGDEVMALFIPGIAGKDYRRKAVRAGRALLEEVGYRDGSAWLDLGVAVHAGEAFVGNVGGEGVMDFTALGDTVNVAARLQAAARPGELVLSQSLWETVEELEPGAEARLLELKGKEGEFPARVARVGTTRPPAPTNL